MTENKRNGSHENMRIPERSKKKKDGIADGLQHRRKSKLLPRRNRMGRDEYIENMCIGKRGNVRKLK